MNITSGAAKGKSREYAPVGRKPNKIFVKPDIVLRCNACITDWSLLLDVARFWSSCEAGEKGLEKEVVWFTPRRWSFTIGLAVALSGALILVVAATAAVYGGVLVGVVLALVGVFIVWYPRKLSRRASAALAGASVRFEPSEVHPGNIVSFRLDLRPHRTIRLYGWRLMLSLMAPDDDESEEYRGIIASVGYRTEFEPQTILLDETATLNATINIPDNFKDSASGQQLWSLTVEAAIMSPRSRLHSMTIRFTAPRGSPNN